MVDSVNNTTNSLIRAQIASTSGLKTAQRTQAATLDQLRKPPTVSVTSTPLASTATPGNATKNLPRGSLVDITV